MLKRNLIAKDHIPDQKAPDGLLNGHVWSGMKYKINQLHPRVRQIITIIGHDSDKRQLIM